MQSRITYHSAPVGARSKLDYVDDYPKFQLTTVLRWERDQNNVTPTVPDKIALPQCSGGSEIKT